jgi:hypothetical protein
LIAVNQPGYNSRVADELPGSASVPDDQPTAHRQVFLLSVEWLVEPHPALSAEQLARAIRHAIEHANPVPPHSPPVPFNVRLKTDDISVEVAGQIEHHHHHPHT